MILSLAIPLLSIVGAAIGLVLLKDLIWFLRSLKYIKQGIPLRYYPFSGYFKHLDNPSKEHGQEDFMKLFENPKNKNQSEKIIQANGFSQPTLFLNDQELVKEFYQKETQVSCTFNAFGFPASDVFIWSHDTKKVQKHRGIFAELFFPANLKKHTPHLRAIVQRHFNRIRDEIKKAGSQNSNKKFAEVELRRNLVDIFTDSVSYVLFGGEIPQVDGEPLVNHIENVVGGYFVNHTSNLHTATLGLSTKLGFDKNFNATQKLYKKIIDKLKAVVRERENNKNYQFGCNVVDLLILKNRELEAQGKVEEMMDLHEIAANIFTMVFAGMDTSRNLTEAALYKLSFEPELQGVLRDTVRKEILDTGKGEVYENYDHSQFLESFLKETFRLYGPASMTFHRQILKTFKLGPYTIHKGTILLIPFNTLQTKPELFQEPLKFDLSKYEEKKKIKDLSKNILIPFSTGKRACIGKNLADIMIKIILCNFLDQFELERSDKPNRRFMALTVGLQHCNARLRSLE